MEMEILRAVRRHCGSEKLRAVIGEAYWNEPEYIRRKMIAAVERGYDMEFVQIPDATEDPGIPFGDAPQEFEDREEPDYDVQDIMDLCSKNRRLIDRLILNTFAGAEKELRACGMASGVTASGLRYQIEAGAGGYKLGYPQLHQVKSMGHDVLEVYKDILTEAGN